VKLDVQVRGETVASLYRESDEYVLKYRAGTPESEFVSLAMPVRDEAWRWPRDLHPFFRQNLPEGYLLNIIREEFGPLLDGTDLSLLAVVGGMGIGRVTVTAEGALPGWELQPLQVEQLLTGGNTAETFSALVRQYARAAISGAMPKFLAPPADLGAAHEQLGKSTLRTSRYIVKSCDNSTPYLGFNEYYSMRVLGRLNVAKVAKTRMSADGCVLIVDRVDVDTNGVPTFGLEDACSLLGLPPNEKYRPSTEAVLGATRAYIPPGLIRAQLEQLGWHILTNYVVRNADCHSKNIALYYTQLGDVGYTPVYDIITTQAYPLYATNAPGLSIEGRKTWAPGKSLESFFKARLGITPGDYKSMLEQLCEAAVETGREMIEAARNEPRWRDITKQMLHAWNEGMASVGSVRKDDKLKGLTPHSVAAGFSDAAPPKRPEVIGRSQSPPKPRAS
jgi:serine/threonine-protein kinase HipA